MQRRSERPAVALDATLWDEPTTGLALYTRSLIGALESEGVHVRRMGARQSGEDPRGKLGATAYTLCRLPFALARAPEPLFHALCNFNLPLWRPRGKRYVLTVHDLIPVLLPETVSAKFRWQFRTWLRRSLHLADRIISGSAHARDDLVKHFHVDPARISVVYHGIDHVRRALDSTETRTAPAIELPDSYVLYAGALDARKNIGLLLAAIAALESRGRRVPLVLMGQKWFGADPVEAEIERMRQAGCEVHTLGHLPARTFYEVMQRAAVFVFPSRYEGFGLPPLEAMSLGVPTVISTAGALVEVCGPAAVQVNPDNPEQLASVLERLLDSPSERQARAEEGKRQAAKFTWKKTAQETLHVYRQALGGFG